MSTKDDFSSEVAHDSLKHCLVIFTKMSTSKQWFQAEIWLDCWNFTNMNYIYIDHHLIYLRSTPPTPPTDSYKWVCLVWDFYTKHVSCQPGGDFLHPSWGGDQNYILFLIFYIILDLLFVSGDSLLSTMGCSITIKVLFGKICLESFFPSNRRVANPSK